MALWTGILDDSRALDWSLAGVTNGIPTTYTKSGSTISAYNGTAGTINTAIANAANNTYVELGAGTFNLSTGIEFQRSNVILRGQGADSTILVLTGSTNVAGLDAAAVMTSGYVDPTTGGVNWTAGYTRGTTTITLASVTNLGAGDILVLSQANDSSRAANNITFGTTSPDFCYGGGGGGWTASRSQTEVHRVVSVSGNDVTLARGLRMPNWDSGKTPQALWITAAPISYCGIEHLTIDCESNDNYRGIIIMHARDCWVKGVKSRFSGRNHVACWVALNCEVRGNHFFEGRSHSDQSYGIELMDASDCLAENNIIVRVTAPMQVAGAATGSVLAYNFSDLDTYSTASWMQPSSYFHAAGSGYVLHEGNHGAGFIADQVHGPSFMVTAFRNNWEGWESGKTSQTIPVHIYAPSRYFNIIGNVLGRSGYHAYYESAASSGTNSYTSIYVLGWGGNGSSGTVTDDSFVKASMMRWGNYDVVSDAVRWESSEVPSSITGSYDNAVPSSQTLPNSFFHSAKPGYFGSVPWPAIGPDVSSGDIANKDGHANSIPAKVFYDTATKDAQGEITDFDSYAFDLDAGLLAGPINLRWRPV